MEAHAGAETMTQTGDAPRVTAEEVERPSRGTHGALGRI